MRKYKRPQTDRRNKRCLYDIGKVQPIKQSRLTYERCACSSTKPKCFTYCTCRIWCYTEMVQATNQQQQIVHQKTNCLIVHYAVWKFGPHRTAPPDFSRNRDRTADRRPHEKNVLIANRTAARAFAIQPHRTAGCCLLLPAFGILIWGRTNKIMSRIFTDSGVKRR